MEQRSIAGRRRGPHGLWADERGFTLVELLVAMLVSLVVIGGGVWVMARAFGVTAKSEDLAGAGATSEVGFERFVLDLRQAVNGTCSGGPSSGDVAVSYTGSLTTVLLCDPNTNAAAIGNAPPSMAVQWQCNTTTSAVSGVPAQTCVRTDAGAGSTHIAGVQSLELTGLVANSDKPVCIAGPTTYGGSNTNCPAASATSTAYTLNAGQTTSLSWIGIQASVGDLTDPGSGQTAVVAGSASIPLQTGADLWNYGT